MKQWQYEQFEQMKNYLNENESDFVLVKWLCFFNIEDIKFSEIGQSKCDD